MRMYKYTIPAGESRSIAARGAFVRGMAGTERYQIQINGFPATEFETGISFGVPGGFDGLRVINTAAVQQEIEISISDQPVNDNRLVGRVDITGGILSKSAPAATIANGVATLITGSAQIIVAANAERAGVVIYPDVDCIIGGSDITEANCVTVVAGQSWETSGSFAVYAKAITGTLPTANGLKYQEESF